MYPATEKYLTMLKKQFSVGEKPATDYKIHKLLGVSKGAVAGWSSGRTGMGDEVGALVADLLGLDPVIVLAELNLDRAQSRASRQFYESILERFKSSAALILCGLAGYLAYPILPPLPI